MLRKLVLATGVVLTVLRAASKVLSSNQQMVTTSRQPRSPVDSSDGQNLSQVQS